MPLLLAEGSLLLSNWSTAKQNSFSFNLHAFFFSSWALLTILLLREAKGVNSDCVTSCKFLFMSRQGCTVLPTMTTRFYFALITIYGIVCSLLTLGVFLETSPIYALDTLSFLFITSFYSFYFRCLLLELLLLNGNNSFGTEGYLANFFNPYMLAKLWQSSLGAVIIREFLWTIRANLSVELVPFNFLGIVAWYWSSLLAKLMLL